MHIQTLYTHPIKSLRPISLSTLTLTPLGPQHDRTFLLLRTSPDTADEILHIGHYSELGLFQPSFLPASAASDENPTGLLVTYTPPTPTPGSSAPERLGRVARSIEVPLQVPMEEEGMLEKRKIVMHFSECVGFDMGETFSEFFTECLGFPTRLIWLGGSTRAVLGNVAPITEPSTAAADAADAGSNEGSSGGLWGSISTSIFGSTTTTTTQDQNQKQTQTQTQNTAEIGFADCAPLLITTCASVEDVSKRLPDGVEMDETKFRPNIVLAGDEGETIEGWEEDFWAEVVIGSTEVTVVLTANCVRCKSINVDYKTGTQQQNNNQPLKVLMKDRRVDPGMKYSPVFGRYGFLKSTDAGHSYGGGGGGGGDFQGEKATTTAAAAAEGRGIVIAVGDKVEVRKRNKERTSFYWPGLSTGSVARS